MPNSVVNIILGNKIVINPLQYVQLNFFEFYRKIIEWFDYIQYNSNLSEIGLNSGSSIVNNLSLICILVFSALIHLIDYLLLLVIQKLETSLILRWITKPTKYVIKKIYS